MQEINRTEIATLGEFGLIKHLTKDIELKNPETQYGVGDDAAVLEFKDKEVLVTTDLLMEGVHFDLVYTPLKHLGYKSAIVNFSDIYAMNGTPKQITVSIALSKRFCIEDLEQFYDGLKLACELHHVDIVGGDTHICSQSDTGCRVYEERIPIDYQTAVMAEELNMNVTTCALNGGEDYELLFTVPLTEHERVSAIEGIKVIGHITKPELGCALITRDGQEFELKAQGWNPLKEK